VIVQLAASAIIVRGDGRVLIGRRNDLKKIAPGLWETIGGKIENNETAEECIRREIWEEIRSGVDSLEFFRHYVYRLSPEFEVRTEVFIVRLTDDPSPNEEDFSQIRWIKCDEMKTYNLISEIQTRLSEYFEATASTA